MSDYKHFALAGAGNVGLYTVDELLKLKDAGVVSSVTVLTRSAGKLDDLAKKGVKVVTVDYTSTSSLANALAGIDVVISTLSGSGINLQLDVAKAAKAAGVQLFVPSEYGNVNENHEKTWFKMKDTLRIKIKELGFPYAIFYTGIWPDFIFDPHYSGYFGFDIPNGKAVIGGSGDLPISFTASVDIARYVVHALTALPRERIEWRLFRIEGDRTTYKAILSAYQARTGKALEITHRSRKELEEAYEKNPEDLVANLLLEWDLGGGVVGRPEELSNSEWPEWNPRKAADVAIETILK